ncbi:MAG: hypothetical protein U0P46_08630 [Holophagaceae bacterium]
MPKPIVDPQILALCAKVTKKRPRTVIDHILKHGYITTEELQDTYGYDHPPRAARDVREEGVPLETFSTESTRSKRKIGAYRFADPSKIKHGRIGGRSAFSKAFKAQLVEKYGEVDAITLQPVESRYLQIDHRIPYEVAGDSEHDENNLDAYMLLDASSQRSKSWSCEGCDNWKSLCNPEICKECYWAYPDKYSHVAMVQVRRIDLLWIGKDIVHFDRLCQEAKKNKISVNALIKQKLEK